MESPIEMFRNQVEAFIEQQLEKYKADIRGRLGSTGRPLRSSTLIAREKGAEDFALFLMGKTSKTERIRGAIQTRRTK